VTDENLALKAQENDYESELELFARYKNTINKISRSFFLVGGDTEDLIQEGMIGLYKAIKYYSLNKNATFSTFASLCIKRQIQNAIKHAGSKKSSPLSSALPLAEVINLDEDEDAGVGLILPSKELLPDAQMISEENMKEIKEQIKKNLSPLEYRILTKYLAGKNYTEIAEQLGTNKKSVDNALSRIKTKLSFLKNDY